MTESSNEHNWAALRERAVTVLIQAAGIDIADDLIHSGINKTSNPDIISRLVRQVEEGATGTSLDLRALGANEEQLRRASEYRSQRASIAQTITESPIFAVPMMIDLEGIGIAPDPLLSRFADRVGGPKPLAARGDANNAGVGLPD